MCLGIFIIHIEQAKVTQSHCSLRLTQERNKANINKTEENKNMDEITRRLGLEIPIS